MQDHDFVYMPVLHSAREDAHPWSDTVVATESQVDPQAISAALAPLRTEASTLVERAPLYWTRVRIPEGARRGDLERKLREAGIPVRYVAAADYESMAPAPPTSFDEAPVARATTWKARRAAPVDDTRKHGRWFMGPAGVNVDRSVCGQGAGTRLAVIDDNASDVEQLDLDAEVLVGVDAPGRMSWHGSVLVAWAIGAIGAQSPEGRRFAGIAPAASARLYHIPKADHDVVSLPRAIIRAVDDGADVVVCATYIQSTTSPMLDDALELAARLGRGGRGALVVFPTSRETSSAAGEVHASLSLSLRDPASDPRAFCIAPSGTSGGWFLYRDRKGALRPFANRGPAVRWLAPGDDAASPFSSSEKLLHSESSGASGMAAGVLLLVLACNPLLRASEVERLLTASVDPIPPEADPTQTPLADPADVLPAGRDRDGHNAKHGYGRLNATRACLGAQDPFALALVEIGEDAAARAWIEMRRNDHIVSRAYSKHLARSTARRCLLDVRASHALRVLARHARLIAGKSARYDAHGTGAVARQLVLVLREFSMARPRPSSRVRTELRTLTQKVTERMFDAPFDDVCFGRLSALWGATSPTVKK